MLPSLGTRGGKGDGNNKTEKNNKDSSVASLGGKHSKLEDDIGFDSLLKNPPKKKVEKPKPKPKVAEKTKKADKKESTKKEKKSSTKKKRKTRRKRNRS